MPTLLGPMVVTGEPEGIKEIFSADPELFEPWAKELIGPVGGENTMVLLTGPRHKRERKLFMPPFHGARMRSYGQTIQDVTRRHVAALAPGQPFQAQDLLMSISMEVIFRAVFGVQREARELRRRGVEEVQGGVHGVLHVQEVPQLHAVPVIGTMGLEQAHRRP